jgi:(4-(4-[2-(gamma-L-glutamylamino)ethyl]phenoxymethyl)furan-2-yl)methanamine synthase
VPTADGRGKDTRATCQRLARMLGCDAGDADTSEWRALAEGWKDVQLRAIQRELARACAGAGLGRDAPVIGAGCGAFLAARLAQRAGRRFIRYADLALPGPGVQAALASWADVCAPAVSVALLASSRG